MNENTNPLAGYFRKPAIYIELPSKGKFYSTGALEQTEIGELPVYPMTALDEITYRTPDALFNGTALPDVITSCVPNIVDPWQMPSTDITAVLTAIRIASFGHNMDIDTQCPKCDTVADYELDLRTVLDGLESPDYSQPMTINELEIFFKPLTYKDINDNSKIQFEEQKLADIVTSNEEMEEEVKLELLSNAFKKVSKYTIETLVKNINIIKTPSESVTQDDFILDFLRNCDRAVYKKIKDHIIKQRSSTELKPLKIQCSNEECSYEYEQPFTLDMTNFFE